MTDDPTIPTGQPSAPPTKAAYSPPPPDEHLRAPLNENGKSGWVWGWFIAVIGWTVLLSFYHMDGGAEFEPTDCWVAQTAREMLEADNWIVPRFSGETRLQKSPGAYWAVMSISELRGVPVDKVAARMPNAFAAVIIVIVVFQLTRKIAGDRAAVFAGFACSSSTLILYWSHRGASDLGLAALITVSLGSLWLAVGHEPPGKKRVVLLLLGYFTAGLGMLYKMPMPLPLIGLPAFLYLLFRVKWRVMASGWHLVGLLLFLAPWLPWALAVYFTEPTALAKWRVEFLDRFTGELPNVEAQKTWYFYFMYLMPTILYTIPFCLSLPAAFNRAFRGRGYISKDGRIFMLIWFLSMFAFFTASVGKETRYFLPALPPLFVLLGVELAALFDPNRKPNPTLLKLTVVGVFISVPAAFIGATFGLHYWYEYHGIFEWNVIWPPYAVTAAIFTMGSWISVTLYAKGRRNASFGALVATMYGLWLWFWPQMMPIMASEKIFIDFANQLRTKLTPEQREDLEWIGSQDSRVIWYGDLRIPRVIDQLELLEMQGGDRSLQREIQIVGEEMVRELQADDRILFVISRPHYVDFMIKAPPQLAERGEEFPDPYIWLQTTVGNQKARQMLVIGNEPPPWEEPEFTPPSERLNEARKRWQNQAATQPATTTQP